MKYFVTVLCLSLVVFCHAQKLDIVSGSSCGKVKLGMTESQVKAIIGNDFTKKTYKEEMRSFRSMGSDIAIDSLVQFVIGFDYCWVAEQDSLVKSPIFTLYFKNGRLNFMGITSYSVKPELVNKVIIDGIVQFHWPQFKCRQIYGKDYMASSYGDYTGDHYYYKKGIELVYDNYELTYIAIFKPIPDLFNRIAARREQLLKEFKSIEPEDSDDDDDQ